MRLVKGFPGCEKVLTQRLDNTSIGSSLRRLCGSCCRGGLATGGGREWRRLGRYWREKEHTEVVLIKRLIFVLNDISPCNRGRSY